ncbi:cytosol aminopeptidase [Drosophila tropicalis]|uniref:cytosol aminopeptidase n=1 Tax=Drosophila tropicalis TaxID=46794 RepID=UPI0035AC2947
MARSLQVLALRRSMIGIVKFSWNHLRGTSQLLKPPSICYSRQQVRHKSEGMNGLVVGVYKGENEKDVKLSTGGEKFDDRVGGKLTELVKECGLDGKLGIGRVINNLDNEFNCVCIVGLGEEGATYNHEEVLDVGMENARVCAAVGARALQQQGCAIVHVDGLDYPEQAAEGAALAVWRNNVNIRKGHRLQIPKLELYGSTDMEAWTRGLFKAESQNLARRLTDTPANQMSPSIFSQYTIDALCPCGVTVEPRSLDWIESMNLNSFLMVAKGSCEPPLILEISYCGTSPEDKSILLLGKGLTFNSGGLCLKPKKGMDEYRGAVSGGAVVVAAIRAAAALSLPINISAVVPLCENMPSGMSTKPGDVVTLLNGMSLCAKNPDKAGVLMMADPLLYAQSNFKPKLVIDVATLSNGATKGLGESASALFTTSSFLWKQFKKAGSMTGDRVWRMPLWEYFDRLVSPAAISDLCNQGRGPASACLAAAILHKLVPCSDWVHLDTNGTGMLAKDNVPPYLLKDSMTGRPTRTVIQFLSQMACK